MATAALLSRLQALGQQLQDATEDGNTGSRSPLYQARRFLLLYLPQEPSVPYRADDLLELLEPSPHIHWTWRQERELVLEGLTLLLQLWLRRAGTAVKSGADNG